MRLRNLLLLIAVASCRDELHPPPRAAVDPPVTSPESIPDAPVSGRIRGAAFVARDARYIVDRRFGYAHTDIVLSSGSAESACSPVSPTSSTSVWLRLAGPGPIASGSLRIAPGKESWQVHYQVFDGAAWQGVGEGAALLVLQEPGPDGRVSGSVATCFPDDTKSCVSGSFNAVACPPTIDQPVRGTPPPEALPQAYLHRMLDGGR
jgi:hypothetical protein